ncbi:hypothetical protein LOD99_6327 [Oopsacas minuta]|uniref:Mos1 transposase HTH domain-containing protein n=1 Tax=Oopsacas minuta TaxID=111878 RepID=A0AAV7JLX2_9METZ|nr:hypothetical protein LOD99_6327 [Oopsacas minuta]
MASKSTDFKIEQRAYVKIRTLFKISPTDVHKDLEEVYKDTALPYHTVVDWARRFREGRVSIEDEAREGRLVSSASDQNILEVSAVIEKDPHIKNVEVANAVGISTGTAQAIGHDNMKFRKPYLCPQIPNNIRLFYTNECLTEIEKFDQNRRLRIGTRRLRILHDNARPHKTKLVREKLEAMKIVELDHSPYSPDLAPCSFELSPRLKKHLSGRKFESHAQMGSAIFQ